MFKLHMTQHIVMSAPFRPPSKATAPKHMLLNAYFCMILAKALEAMGVEVLDADSSRGDKHISNDRSREKGWGQQ